MKFLVVYGTTEGQTRKIADGIAERIRAHGPAAEAIDSTAAPAELDLGAYDAVVIAASVHQHRHQASVMHFVKHHLARLQAMPTAFVSVSLAVAMAGEEGEREARSYVDRFLADTGWQPTEVHLAAGALLYTAYDFFKRQIMKFIVWKSGGPTETDQDYEFTDWAELSRFVDSFVEKVSS